MLELADEIEALEGEPRDTGLDRNLAGALCYLIGPGVLLFPVGFGRERRPASKPALRSRGDFDVRFHAFQALLLAVSLLVIDLTLHVLEAAVYRASWYAGLRATAFLWWVYAAQVLFWLVMLFFGYELSRVRVPGVRKAAEFLARG